ncbi:hypothetical protein M441DRAFT_135927 [Trichoderma asperellum CBS 433.97]|uniref:Uncharacterized protein n=1 Tax=Trichoderma asperellum (strain ATCC 204424 / CBS 433.97 / NBRC 101777) TaxID=1042311 RepID=A0A2T3ZDK8_TRIA4|nr:hypothetical protein M441DRAFT_135927 [Trichoderma asperellum CBS 433.97]PTB42874.1 hypothetical protein M441DRAFT_135927 [Trichoderma asperellum CBS 433.97]
MTYHKRTYQFEKLGRMVCRSWLLRDLYLVWKVGEFGLNNEQLCYLLFRYGWIPDDEERKTRGS